jgi:hypothetical protein
MHIATNHRQWPNRTVLAYLYIPNNNRTGINKHFIAKLRGHTLVTANGLCHSDFLPLVTQIAEKNY